VSALSLNQLQETVLTKHVKVGLSTALIEVSKRPDIIQTIRKEWNAEEYAPDLSVLLNITPEGLREKQITKATFLEALRYRAPVAVASRRAAAPLALVASDGNTIEVPAGMRILCSLDANMRQCPAVNKPKRYDPAHILGVSANIVNDPETFAFCPFGGESTRYRTHVQRSELTKCIRGLPHMSRQVRLSSRSPENQ
jgi:cytochrome P450